MSQDNATSDTIKKRNELLVAGYIHILEKTNFFCMNIHDVIFELILYFFPISMQFGAHCSKIFDVCSGGYQLQTKRDDSINYKINNDLWLVYAKTHDNISIFNGGIHYWSIKNSNVAAKVQKLLQAKMLKIGDAVDVYEDTELHRWNVGRIIAINSDDTVKIIFQDIYQLKSHSKSFPFDSDKLAVFGTYTNISYWSQKGYLGITLGRNNLITRTAVNLSKLVKTLYAVNLSKWKLHSRRTIKLDCNQWKVTYYEDDVAMKTHKIAPNKRYSMCMILGDDNINFEIVDDNIGKKDYYYKLHTEKQQKYENVKHEKRICSLCGKICDSRAALFRHLACYK